MDADLQFLKKSNNLFNSQFNHHILVFPDIGFNYVEKKKFIPLLPKNINSLPLEFNAGFIILKPKLIDNNYNFNIIINDLLNFHNNNIKKIKIQYDQKILNLYFKNILSQKLKILTGEMFDNTLKRVLEIKPNLINYVKMIHYVGNKPFFEYQKTSELFWDNFSWLTFKI